MIVIVLSLAFSHDSYIYRNSTKSLPAVGPIMTF